MSFVKQIRRLQAGLKIIVKSSGFVFMNNKLVDKKIRESENFENRILKSKDNILTSTQIISYLPSS